MLKMVEGLREKLQNKDGFWEEKYEHGFYAYINKNEEIDVCSEQEISSLESYGYKVIWVGVDCMGANTDDVINYIGSKVSTLDIKQTIKNLIGLEGDDLENDIICAFDTTDKEVIVSSQDEMNNFNGKDGIHSAYENLEDSPIIQFRIKDGKVIDAWEA